MKKSVVLCGILVIFLISVGNLHAQKTTYQIPSIQLSTQIDTVEGVLYYVHTVKKGETLYSISKAYQCNESDIIRENEEGLAIGERLLIPTKEKIKPHADTVAVVYKEKSAGEKLTISLILPLYLDSISEINPTVKSKAIQKAFNFLPFYEGAKMAWKESPDLTSEMELHIFDVTEDTNSVIKVLNDSNFIKSDLIICAAFVKSFQAFNQFSIDHKTPIIHPISERNLTHNNPYYIQAYTSTHNQIQLLAEHYVSLYPDDVYILLTNGAPKVEEKIAVLSENLIKFNSKIKLKVYNTKDSGFSVLINQLDQTRNNIVFNFFDKEIDYTNTILSLTKSSAHITMICTDNCLQFNKIEPEYLQRLNCEYFSTYFVDYKNKNVQTFERNYLNTYYNLPSALAYKGYDIMNFIIHGLFQYDTKFSGHLNTIEQSPLSTEFNFKKNKKNGYENQYIHTLKLVDYEFIPNKNQKPKKIK